MRFYRQFFPALKNEKILIFHPCSPPYNLKKPRFFSLYTNYALNTQKIEKLNGERENKKCEQINSEYQFKINTKRYIKRKIQLIYVSNIFDLFPIKEVFYQNSKKKHRTKCLLLLLYHYICILDL